jgi:cytochrome c oxidase subunit II
MSRRRLELRAARRERLAERQRTELRWRRIRRASYSLVLLIVLSAGGAMAAADLLEPRGASTVAGGISVRASMAGFTPAIIEAHAGEQVTIDFWTTDSAPHLERGVHTFISDELAVYEELPAEGRRSFSFAAPATPGDYDVYCDTCCGGRQSPTMHAVVRVEA